MPHHLFVRLALGVAMALGAAACGAEAPEQRAVSGDLAIDEATCSAMGEKYPDLAGRELAVGISPAPANYSTTDPDDPEGVIGIEPDLLDAAGRCLGFTTSYTRLDFAGLVPALQAGRIDLVAAGMYSSPERLEQVDFVDYMAANEASLVAAGNPEGITGLSEVCGHTAALMVGTVENAILEEQGRTCVADGEAPLQTLSFPSIDRAQSAVAAGEADVILTDAGVAAYLAQRDPDTFSVGFDLPTDFRFGFGVGKQATELRDGLAEALVTMSDSGGLQRAMQRWGFADSQRIRPAAVSG